MPQLDLSQLRAELELEREWREAEMRLLRNHVSQLNPSEQDVARKALVVMLYAHFEGVCKALLSIYVNHLNRLGLKVSEIVSALSASSLDDVFHALHDPNKKCAEFRNTLPDDTALHRFAREKEFMEVAWRIGERQIRLNPEVLVDTQSNLRPVVLKKILFRLGFSPDLSAPWDGDIHMLLNRRNNVAHGLDRGGISAEDYGKLEEAVRKTVDKIILAIFEAASTDAHLHKKAAIPPPSERPAQAPGT